MRNKRNKQFKVCKKCNYYSHYPFDGADRRGVNYICPFCKIKLTPMSFTEMLEFQREKYEDMETSAKAYNLGLQERAKFVMNLNGKEGSGKSSTMKKPLSKKENRKLGFILGLMYAPFLWFIVEGYYYLGRTLGAIMWSTDKATAGEYLTLSLLILVMAIIMLIIAIAPIYWYLRVVRR